MTTKFTQRQLRNMVKEKIAVDITSEKSRDAIPEPYTQCGYSAGKYGCNGKLFIGLKTGKLYAVTANTTAIYIF